MRTAEAVASGGAAAPVAVLQATGCVTVCRQATVSTQITGTLSKVTIKEDQHVEEGQVIAQLEDGDLARAGQMGRHLLEFE